MGVHVPRVRLPIIVPSQNVARTWITTSLLCLGILCLTIRDLANTGVVRVWHWALYSVARLSLPGGDGKPDVL
jgi:hypothetical protein